MPTHSDGFHYRQNATAGKDSQPSTVLTDNHILGDKLSLDYSGDTPGYIDMETGEKVKVQTLVAAFRATDYGFAICVSSQKMENFV